MHIMRVLGEEREKRKKIFEIIITENFPQISDIKSTEQEAQITLSRTMPKYLHLGISVSHC